MIDAVEELVMSLGPSTMAGLMTTMSSSLSLAKAQAAFSVMVFATGPHSCSEDSTTTHDLQHNQVWKNSQSLPSQSSSSWHRTSKDSIGRTSSSTSSSSWTGSAGDGGEERERERHTHTHTWGDGKLLQWRASAPFLLDRSPNCSNTSRLYIYYKPLQCRHSFADPTPWLKVMRWVPSAWLQRWNKLPPRSALLSLPGLSSRAAITNSHTRATNYTWAAVRSCTTRSAIEIQFWKQLKAPNLRDVLHKERSWKRSGVLQGSWKQGR